jgi:hypothetical protein
MDTRWKLISLLSFIHLQCVTPPNIGEKIMWLRQWHRLIFVLGPSLKWSEHIHPGAKRLREFVAIFLLVLKQEVCSSWWTEKPNSEAQRPVHFEVKPAHYHPIPCCHLRRKNCVAMITSLSGAYVERIPLAATCYSRVLPAVGWRHWRKKHLNFKIAIATPNKKRLTKN